MVDDLVACRAASNLATDVPTRTGTPEATCLSAAQKTALQNVMDRAKNSAGQSLCASRRWDPGTRPPGLPSLADGGLGYQLGFNMDTDAPKFFATTSVYKESAMDFMRPPNALRTRSSPDGRAK